MSFTIDYAVLCLTLPCTKRMICPVRAIYIFAVQLGMTLFVLLGLSVLRHDAGRLVLGPLRRILKIVAFCKYMNPNYHAPDSIRSMET